MDPEYFDLSSNELPQRHKTESISIIPVFTRNMTIFQYIYIKVFHSQKYKKITIETPTVWFRLAMRKKNCIVLRETM